MSFLTKSKPNSNLTFFQNYANHIKALDKSLGHELALILTEGGAEFEKNLFKHLNMFDGLRDGHDYMDSVVGATVLPIVGTAMRLLCLTKSIGELTIALGEQAGFLEGDSKNHYGRALLNFGAWAVAQASTLLYFANSLISLISRPIATLVQGWKKPEDDRFRKEFSKGNDTLSNLAYTFIQH
jgi:hypothetical protein